MRLPRWTAYVALAVIAVLLVTAIPRRMEATPSAPKEHRRIVVLGIDGMDPDILREAIENDPESMANFKQLAEEGSGVLALGTATPPQSPVAWSNFITGRNPGGHGVFDFIHRDPKTYGVAPSTVTTGESTRIPLPGQWQFPIEGGGDSNRSGKAFWTILGEHGVPASVWRMPINFPVEPGEGYSIPGMMTPAVDSAYGEMTFYSTSPPLEHLGSDKVKQLSRPRNGIVRTSVIGPVNSFKESAPREQVPLAIYVDEERGSVALELEDQVVVLEPGEWSRFLNVSFDMLPMHAMSMAGIVRFYLRSIEPELELYASPINVDPYAPISPISHPDDASAEIADYLGGAYYTQGMAEDVGSRKKDLLTVDEFMQQTSLVFDERGRMLDMALERFAGEEQGGLLFFYYSTVDLCSHMMWRHTDEEHPHHEPEVAAHDSSWWSGREGSTWKDFHRDVYAKMDDVLGEVRAAVGEDTPIIVMSDHGFAPYYRKFNLNNWLVEEGYLVLKEGEELPPEGGKRNIQLVPDPEAEGGSTSIIDWSRSKAYGVGFNGLYLNLKGREARGVVEPGAEADALLAELKRKLEGTTDPGRYGTPVVLAADLAKDVYNGERLAEAPDVLVGYNAGYGNSDEASTGYLEHSVLADNLGGTFNGSHLMDPRVVSGVLVTNMEVSLDDPCLEDLTVELLRQYGIDPDPAMDGRPVLQ